MDPEAIDALLGRLVEWHLPEGAEGTGRKASVGRSHAERGRLTAARAMRRAQLPLAASAEPNGAQRSVLFLKRVGRAGRTDRQLTNEADLLAACRRDFGSCEQIDFVRLSFAQARRGAAFPLTSATQQGRPGGQPSDRKASQLRARYRTSHALAPPNRPQMLRRLLPASILLGRNGAGVTNGIFLGRSSPWPRLVVEVFPATFYRRTSWGKGFYPDVFRAVSIRCEPCPTPLGGRGTGRAVRALQLRGLPATAARRHVELQATESSAACVPDALRDSLHAANQSGYHSLSGLRRRASGRPEDVPGWLERIRDCDVTVSWDELHATIHDQ